MDDEKTEAEVRFKAVSQAYEILRDDEKRHLYDTHGMSAFGPRGGGNGGMHSETDLNDLFSFFGMDGNVPGASARGPRRPARTEDERKEYEVTLEELYKGKTAKFASSRTVVCGHCKGSGGKEHAKAKECTSCEGNGPLTLVLSCAMAADVTTDNFWCVKRVCERVPANGKFCHPYHGDVHNLQRHRYHLQGKGSMSKMQGAASSGGEEGVGALHTSRFKVRLASYCGGCSTTDG